jgi:HK97 family phage prohead protease
MDRLNLAYGFQVRATGDSQDGIVEGYASIFDTVDAYESVIMPGAFQDSLQQKGISRIKVLWNHCADEPIGKLLNAYEDAKGLFVQFKLSLGVEKAMEVYTLIRDGVIDSMSFGFNISDYAIENGILMIKKVDLWEVSPVTFPANPQAQITGIRNRVAKDSESPEAREAIGDILAAVELFKIRGFLASVK